MGPRSKRTPSTWGRRYSAVRTRRVASTSRGARSSSSGWCDERRRGGGGAAMIGRYITNERGNVLMFTIGFLVLMLVMGGIAVDLAYYGVVDNELQRATDARSE